MPGSLQDRTRAGIMAAGARRRQSNCWAESSHKKRARSLDLALRSTIRLAVCACFVSFSELNVRQSLAAHFHIATVVDHDLHRMTTAGPGVDADLATEYTTAPANRWRFGATTGHANSHCLRATAAWRTDAQGGQHRRWRTAAATTTCFGSVYRTCPQRGSHDSRSYPRKTKHHILPSEGESKCQHDTTIGAVQNP